MIPIKMYPDCEIGHSMYGKSGELLGLVTKDDCLHCLEDKEIQAMSEEAEKRQLTEMKYV